MGLVPSECRTLHFPMLNLVSFLLAHFFNLLKFLWTATRPFHWGTHPQFCVISKLVEGSLCPIIQLTTEDLKQNLPLGYTAWLVVFNQTCCWSPLSGHSYSASFKSTMRFCSSSHYFINFSMKTMSKAFLNSRWTIMNVVSSSIKVVISWSKVIRLKGVLNS